MFSNSNGGSLMKKIFLTIIFLFFAVPSFAVDCKTSDTCFVLGMKMLQQKEYQNAKQCFELAVSMEPEYYLNYAYRAKANFYLGNYELTFEDASKSIKLQPNPRAFGLRGSAKLALGDNLGAIEDATKAIELDPKYMKCYEVRARAEANLGDYVESMKDSLRAIKLRDNYAKSYEVLAYSQVGLKDYQSAIESFEKAAKLFKQDKDGKNYRLMNQKIKYYKRLIK